MSQPKTSTFQHNNTPIFIHDKRWYFRLKKSEDTTDDAEETKTLGKRSPPKAKSLMDQFRLEELEGKLIICMITPKDVRLYSMFESYIEFAIFSRKISPENRSFYEIVLAEFPQKPRFDIDVNTKDYPNLAQQPIVLTDGTQITSLDQLGELLKDTVIELMIAVLADKGVRVDISKDVLVFTSHGPNKRSYHVVLNNYCHYHHKEARALYDMTMARVPEHLKCVVKAPQVDPAVYSSKQQFRIVGSQKIGSGRPKTFAPVWRYKGQEIRYKYIEEPADDNHALMLQLEASILTHTSSCDLLPTLLDPNDEGLGKMMSKARYDTENISMALAKKALQLVATAGGSTIDDRRFPYAIEGIKGGIVCLKRTRPSKCGICCRVHEHENPFLVVAGHEDSPEKGVYFYCRRSPHNKRLYLGKLEDFDTVPSGESHFVSTRDAWLYSEDVISRVRLLAMVNPVANCETVKTPAEIKAEQKKHKELIDRSFIGLAGIWK